jgi:hypothetical protein
MFMKLTLCFLAWDYFFNTIPGKFGNIIATTSTIEQLSLSYKK